jgi:hypothetical protein
MEEKNTPETGFCRAYSIDMLWNIGGDAPQRPKRRVKSAL